MPKVGKYTKKLLVPITEDMDKKIKRYCEENHISRSAATRNMWSVCMREDEALAYPSIPRKTQ